MTNLITSNIANSVNLPLIDRIKRDAVKYERCKDQLVQVPQNEIDLFRNEVSNTFDRIANQERFLNDLSLFCFEPGNPYESLEEMTKDMTRQKRIYISTDHSESQLLPGDLNLKFRAVHDYLHYLYQQPFEFAGEYSVYKVQRLFHSTKIGRKLLYSEVVLQAAYATYFGKFSEVQKVIIY